MHHHNWKKTKANKRINTKQSLLRQQKVVDKLFKKIKVKIVDNPVKLAIDSYTNLHPQQPFRSTFNNEFLLRITLNYIRHCLSNYEKLIQKISTLKYNYQEFKQMVNKTIMQKYGDKLFASSSDSTYKFQLTII